MIQRYRLVAFNRKLVETEPIAFLKCRPVEVEVLVDVECVVLLRPLGIEVDLLADVDVELVIFIHADAVVATTVFFVLRYRAGLLLFWY
jgi:hypothetical protein